MEPLKQSTARNLMVFMVDDTDHVTGKTGLTLTITASKDGAAFGSISPTVTERGNGWYNIALTSSHTDTLGDLALHITGTDADPLDLVRPVEVDRTGASVSSVTGAVASVTGNVGGNVTGSVGSVATGGITAASFAANAITAAKLDPDVTTELQAGLATASALATVDTVVDAIKAVTDLLPDAGALTSLATASALATVDGIVDDILVDTAVIGAAGAGLTAIPWNAAWDAEVQSEAADALTAYDPPTRAELTSDVSTLATAAALATVDTVVDAIKVSTDKLDDTVEDDGGVFRFTAEALAEAPTGGSAPSAADIADAVWDEVAGDHVTSGTTGAALGAAGSAGDPWETSLPGAYGSGTAGKIIGDNLNATISSRASQTSVDDLPTNAELATSQAAADDATLAAIAALNNLSAGQVRTELATELGRLDAAVSTRATPAQVATELGTYDAPTKAELDAAVAPLATQTSVNDVPTNAELATALAAADDAVLSAIAALNNLSAAQINAEVLDVLTTDTFAEPGSVPAATASLKDKIGWLAVLARNKVTQTATTQTVRNDADSADLATATVSDDGTTFVKAEWS